MDIKKIIDIHSHFNIGSPFDCRETVFHKRDFETMMSGYDLCKINVGAFSPFSAVLEGGESGIYRDNEYMFNFAAENPRIYQWVVLDPRQEELFTQIRGMIDGDKVMGIKIHSPYHKYDIDEYADRIFSFADELGCFVLMHPDKIENMASYADRYRNMKLIIAHLGSVEHVDAIANARYGNVFTDTSGGASSNNSIIEYAVGRIGSEKIFFGTDTYSCGFQRGRIEYAGISDKDKENIFYNNAKKHFRRQFKDI